MHENTNNDELFGFEEARRGGWTNAEWLRYRATGYEPEAIIDEKELANLQAKVLETHSLASHLLSEQGAKELATPDKRYGADDFIRYFGKITDNVEGLTSLDETEQAKILDKQYASILEMDKHGVCLISGQECESRKWQEFLNKFRIYIDGLLGNIEKIGDSTVKAKYIKNIYITNSVLIGLDRQNEVQELLDTTIKSDLQVLGACFYEDDYGLGASLLMNLKPSYDGERPGLPYYFYLDKSYQQDIPKKVIKSYAKYLLSPIVHMSSKVIERQGLETLGMNNTLVFLSGLMERVREDRQLLDDLQRNGLDFQATANQFFRALHQHTQEPYRTAVISDRTWQQTLILLKSFYGQGENLSLAAPKELDKEWIAEIIHKKRKETGLTAIDLANSIGINFENE